MTHLQPPGPTKVLIAPRRGWWLAALSGGYAVFVLILLGLVRWVGDAWWGVTVLLFLPRWTWLAPVAVLAVVSGLRRCPGHWALQGATAAVVAGPLMGLSAPVRRLWETPPDGQRVRVATFNLSTDPVRAGDFLRWVGREKIDVVCFQEGGREEDETRRAFREAGWHLSARRSLASRLPVVGELPAFAESYGPGERYSSALERVRLRAPDGAEFVAASVHLPTLRRGFQRLINHGDVNGLRRHTAWWGREVSRVLSALAEVNDVPLIVAGDFNMPDDDSTMAALRANFRFAFEEAGWGYGYTRPASLPWVRIDHVLTGPDWSVTACRVGPAFGSDHRPLMAEAVLPPPPIPNP